MPMEDIKFLGGGSDGADELDFKQISDSLFGHKNLRQKTDLSKKEILGIVYLEMLNEEFKKELGIISEYRKVSEEDHKELINPTVIERFISFYTQYKISTDRKGRNELVNSFTAQIEKRKQEEIIKQEIV